MITIGDRFNLYFHSSSGTIRGDSLGILKTVSIEVSTIEDRDQPILDYAQAYKCDDAQITVEKNRLHTTGLLTTFNRGTIPARFDITNLVNDFDVTMSFDLLF